MSSQESSKLNEFQLYNVLLLALTKFKEEVEKTNTTDWEAFDTFVGNLDTYATSFSNVEYIYKIRTTAYNFLNLCREKDVITDAEYRNYCNRVQNQLETMIKDSEVTNEMSFLIRTLYEKDRMFTDGRTMSDFSFDTIAMLLDLPQKLANYINSQSFRQDLFETLAKAHAMYVCTPSTINGTRYNNYIRILYIIGLLEQGVNDFWIDETVDNDTEFQSHLAELLGIDLAKEALDGYTEVF